MLESDDSGSEFDPEGDAAESDLADELDDDDEEVLLYDATQQSLQTAREDRERAAGLTSAGAGSSKARPPANKAAALRAAAAERRRAQDESSDVIDLTTEPEASLSESESDEEPLSKGKSKGKAKAKGKQVAKPLPQKKSMTIAELKKLKKEERKQARERRYVTAVEEAALRKELGRRLTYVSLTAQHGGLIVLMHHTHRRRSRPLRFISTMLNSKMSGVTLNRRSRSSFRRRLSSPRT